MAVRGYDRDVMEPFLSRDGTRLFFNDSNDPRANTDLHVADRVDDVTFAYRGRLRGVNTPSLDAVPSLDRDGLFYFVSTRSYESTLSTIYRGRLDDDSLEAVEVVPGVSRGVRGMINFDVEVAADGQWLYFVDGRFGRDGPETADLVAARRTAAGFERDAGDLFREVNTADLEYAPAVSADGLVLVFTRADAGLKGAVSLFVSTRESVRDRFRAAARLVDLEGLVEAATFTPEGGAIYFHRRDGAKYGLYRARRGRV